MQDPLLELSMRKVCIFDWRLYEDEPMRYLRQAWQGREWRETFSFVAVVGSMPFDGACRMFQEPPAFFFYPPSFWPFPRSSMGKFGRLKSCNRTFFFFFSKSAKSRHSRFPWMAWVEGAEEAHRASPNTGWNEAVWTWAAWTSLGSTTFALSMEVSALHRWSPDTGEGEAATYG